MKKTNGMTKYQYLVCLRDAYASYAASCVGTPDWELCKKRIAGVDAAIASLTLEDAESEW